MAHDKNKVAVIDTKLNLPTLPPDIDFAADMEEFGANYSQSQMTTPFMNVVQSNSPQVTRGKPEYLPEAKAGMLYNTVTKNLYDGEVGINLILSTFKESYIEWVPRNKGGGFVKEYDLISGTQARTMMDPDFNQVIQPDSPIGNVGNYLSLTHTRLGAIVSDDLKTWSPVVLSMSASGIKVSKNLNARHQLLEWINPSTGKPGPLGRCPMPLILWTAKTKLMTNDKGSWFTWDFEKKNFLYEIPEFIDLYRSIRDFAGSSKGHQVMEDAARDSVIIEGTATVKDLNDEIPF